jgi:mRNA interferase RelE/StbE
MSFRVSLKPSAHKELGALPEKVRGQIASALLHLGENPHPPGSIKLKGREGYRVRSGDYRILYAVDHSASVVTILAIGHRRDIYR